MGRRLEIDLETCVGAGMCVVAAPAIFDQNEVDARVVLRQSADVTNWDAVSEAVLVCPSGALSIVDDDENHR